MIPKFELNSIIEELNKERKATLAEFLYAVYHDKFIEIYLGDSYEEIKVDQISTAYPTVFTGKVIAAYKEALVLEGQYNDRYDKRNKFGKQIIINERAIRGLCEVDGHGIIDDIFLRSRESAEVKSLDKK